jgi:hypothetical protein
MVLIIKLDITINDLHYDHIYLIKFEILNLNTSIIVISITLLNLISIT